MAIWKKKDNEPTNFYIISNRNKDENHKVAEEIRAYLEKKSKYARIVGRPRDIVDKEWPDMVIVLGGDGYVLQTAKHFLSHIVPILGVNFGTLGFLSEVEQPHIFDALELLCKGEYSVANRMSLVGNLVRGVEHNPVEVISNKNDNTGVNESTHAINEFFIGKSDIGHLMTAEIYVDGKFADTYVADGVIVSTPTGSTAYNLSAAGPILTPNMDAMIITPICPHALNKRSIVVSAQSTIQVVIKMTKSTYDDGAIVLVDGKTAWRAKTGDILTIKKTDDTFQMVELGEVSFFDKMRSKLNRD